MSIQSHLAPALLGAFFCASAGLAQAQPSFNGHYPIGVEGLKGGSLPPPGLYLRDYNLFYWADRLNDAHSGAVPADFKAFVYAQAPRVDRAIIAEAEAQGCDLIVMVTHGRGAFGEFLFGSQTKAVLSGSRLPLLVLH